MVNMSFELTFWTALQANHLYTYHRCMGKSMRQSPAILNRLIVYTRILKIAEKTFDFVHRHNSTEEKQLNMNQKKFLILIMRIGLHLSTGNDDPFA